MITSNITNTSRLSSPILYVGLRLLEDLGPGTAAGIVISEIAIRVLKKTQHMPTKSTAAKISCILGSLTALLGVVEISHPRIISPTKSNWVKIASLTGAYFGLRIKSYWHAMSTAPLVAPLTQAAFTASASNASS